MTDNMLCQKTRENHSVLLLFLFLVESFAICIEIQIAGLIFKQLFQIIRIGKSAFMVMNLLKSFIRRFGYAWKELYTPHLMYFIGPK